MALSGNVATNHFSDSTVNETYMQFNWSATQSTSGNYSTVNWEIVAHRPDTSNYVYFHNFSRTVYGAYNSKGSSNYKNNEVIDSGSFTVYHSDNGEGSFSISMSANVYYSSGGQISVEKTFILDTIPRYATSVQSLKSKTSSSITINWSSDSTIDYIWYSNNNGSSWTGINVTDGKSGSYTISGLSANTTYKIKTRVRRKDSQLTTDSSTLSVTTYAKTTPTISLLNKTVNSITVSSSCNVNVSNTRYILRHYDGNWGAWQTSPTFTGLSPNSTYVIQVEKRATESGEAGYAEIIVTTHDIARLTNYSNFNLGDNVTIKYSNPSGAPIQVGIYSLDGRTPYAQYRTASGSSYTFLFTDEELDEFYKAIGKNNALNVNVYVNTNNNEYRDYKGVTITLTGNQKTAHIGKNGVIKRGKVFIARNGVKRGVLWLGINGTARRCI